MSGERFITPVWKAEDENGVPYPNAKLYFYDNNTTNPKTIYANVGLTTTTENPAIADGAGWFINDIFLQNSAYRVALHDEDDVLIWSKDDVNNIVQNTTTGNLPLPGMVVGFVGTQVQLDDWLSNGWFVMDGNNGTINTDQTYIRGVTNIAGIGLTGGSNLVTTTGTVSGHVLTISEMPSHDHDQQRAAANVASGANFGTVGGAIVSGQTGTRGGGQAHDHGLVMDQHNNEPSYIQWIWLYYPG